MSMLYTNSLLMLERALNFQWTKQSAINDNIVNAETPNYKAKYVTFEEALDSSIRSALRRPDHPLSRWSMWPKTRAHVWMTMASM